ncbi:MAG: TraR/DksA family transcriptional regulator [Planctomycetota bacterium]
MKNRSIELRKLVRSLRGEFSRLHREHLHEYDDHDIERVLRVQQVALYEVKQALQLADQGAYGTCIGCDREIPLARLRARPASIRCIGCQERLEASTAA